MRGLTITNMMISFLVVAAVIFGLQIFAGSVFTAYNTTADTTFMSQYSQYNSTLQASQSAYSSLAPKHASTPSNLFIAPFVIAAWNALKAMITGIATATTMPATIGNQATQSGYGFAGLDTFIGIASAIVLTSVVGYIIYALLGRGGSKGSANI